MSQSRSRSGRVPSSRNDKSSPSSGHQSDRRYDRHATKATGSSSLTDASEAEVTLLSEHMSIEADGEFDAGGDFDALVGDEDLDAAFEAEHGGRFCIVDEVGDDRSEESEQNTVHHADRERVQGDRERKKFVIPKMKQLESEKQHEVGYSSSEEGKREWRKNERESRPKDHDAGRREKNQGDRDRGRRDSKERRGEREKHRSETESQNGQSSQQSHSGISKPSQEDRTSLFDSFVAEGLIPAEDFVNLPANEAVKQEFSEAEKATVEQEAGPETTVAHQDGASEKESEELAVPMEEEGALEIPMGRDSLVVVRGKPTLR